MVTDNVYGLTNLSIKKRFLVYGLLGFGVKQVTGVADLQGVPAPTVKAFFVAQKEFGR